MQTPAPRVTAVVPVWDRHVAFLDAALASLRGQQPPPHLIVVDNASTVPVRVGADVELVAVPSRCSAGAARNAGLARVTTPEVLFWDADDVMPPGALAALESARAGHPGAVLVAAAILDEAGRPHHWPRPRITRALSRWPAGLAGVSAISSLLPSVGALLDRDAVRDAGGFPDLDYGDDWVLAVALALRGPVVLLDTPGRVYRRHPAALSPVHASRTARHRHAAAVADHLAADPRTPPWLAALARAHGPLRLAQRLVIDGLSPLRRHLARRGRPTGRAR